MADWKEYKTLSINGQKRSLQGWRAYAQEALQEGVGITGFEDILQFVVDWSNRKEWIEVRTSGSTGRPKTVKLPKQHIVHSALRTIQALELPTGCGALMCLPNKYIGGKMMIARAVIGEMDLWVADQPGKPMMPEHVEICFAAMVPFQMSAILKDEEATKRWKNVHSILLGGAHLDSAMEEKLSTWPNHVYESFGMTETISHIALRRVSGVSDRQPFTALPDISLSTDERGCLVIHSEALPQNPTTTNDLVEMVGDRSFHWLGRVDNVINSGGIKIIPESLEKQLRPKVHTRFFLTGMPDEALGEKLTLVLESQPMSAEDESELLNDLRSGLGKYEAPRAIRYAPAFAETENGKIHRKQSLKNLLQPEVS